MKRGDIIALVLFLVQAGCVFYQALYVPPVVPGLGDHYFNIPLLPLSEGLSSIRTLGYPAFHAAMAYFGWGLASYPTFHMMALLPCIFVFWWGLRAYGLPGLAALAAVSPLFYLVPVEVVMPETLAKCFAIAGIGFLLWAAGTRRLLAYVGLAVSVFLAYQMRPAFLFLVGFLPVAWFFLYTRRWGLGNQVKWLWHGGATAAACVAPLALFCLLRLLLVGHFGLVSFGGQNTVGISVEMLNTQVVDSLPVGDRPLARTLYRTREGWPTERFLTARGVVAGWDVIARQYTVNVNRIGRIVQAKLPAETAGNDNVANDKALSRMSLATFAARPDVYAAWVTASAVEGASVAMRLLLGGGGDFSFRWGRAASITLAVLVSALALFSWPLERRAHGEIPRAHATRAATVVAFAAVLFFALKMLLVILVEPPIPRYVQAAAFLLPCALAAHAWDRAVVLASGLLSRSSWYGQCYAAYPPISDVPQAVPWRRGLTLVPTGWRTLALAGATLILVLAAVWWTTRDHRLFHLLSHDYGRVRSALLTEVPPVQWRDEAGATLLHYAALRGDGEVVVHLLAAGADVAARTADGSTPLHWAAMGENGGTAVAPLVAAGAPVHEGGSLGLSPIHLASLFGRVDVVEALATGGADVNRKTAGHVAPLHLAACPDVARALLSYGAAVDIRDGSNGTPFMWAHTFELGAYFLAEGADINAQENWRSFVRGCTPLHKAAYQGDVERARWLLARGADPNAGDINHLSPLFYASWRNDRAMAELLLDHGANPNHQGRWVAYHRENPGTRYTDIYGKTIGRHPKRDTFAALVPDKAGIRPLDFAAFTGNAGMVDWLIERGADLGGHNEFGMSVLHWAELAYRDAIAHSLRARDPELRQLDHPMLPVGAFREWVRAGALPAEKMRTVAVRGPAR